MDSATYLREAAKTDVPSYSNMIARLQDEHTVRLLHAAMGICTEGGEFMDALKKYLVYGRSLDRVNMLEEMGDLEWYVALALLTLGSTHDSIFEVNIAKLKARYPEKFTEFAALNRDLEKEREILEDGHGDASTTTR